MAVNQTAADTRLKHRSRRIRAGQVDRRRAQSRPAEAPPAARCRRHQHSADVGGRHLRLQARTVNEVLKAKLNNLELAQRKKELVDRAQAVATFSAGAGRARRVVELACASRADGIRLGVDAAYHARRWKPPCASTDRVGRTAPARGLMDDYEANPDYRTRVARWARRPARYSPYPEWSDRHRMLSSKGVRRAGRWRTSRTPYLKAIMDYLSPTSPVERVVFMKGAARRDRDGSNWIGYVIHHAPGPMMAVWPTVEMAKRNSKQRIDPLIEESSALKERIARRARAIRATPFWPRSSGAACW